MNKAGWPYNSLIENVYLPLVREKGEQVLRSMVLLTIPKQSFLEAYKTISPMETMNDQEKKEMKEYVIAMFPEMSSLEKLEACKIIYTIGTLLN